MPGETETKTEETKTTAVIEAPEKTEPATEELGDAGKKALDEERKGRRTAEKAAKDAVAELEKVKAENATEQEKALAAAKAEGRTEALTVANERLLRAEVKAAAAGKFADPSLAAKVLDLDDFEVKDDGSIDTAGITSAIDAFLKDHPEFTGKGTRPAPLPGGAATASEGVSMDDWIRGKARTG